MPEELNIQEAAMLPESDPLRQEWERKVAQSTPQVQAQWRELLAQAEQSRLQLRDIGLPEGLLTQLLTVPADGELGAAALLPADDPIRLEMESRLVGAPGPATMSINGTTSHHVAATGAHWQTLLEQSERLRSALRDAPDAQLPASLNKRLFAIPQSQARRWWQVSPVIRYAAAAILLVGLFFAGQFGLNQYQAFQDHRTLNQVAALVVSQHPAPPTPLVQSTDENAILEVLLKQGMSMPPIIVPYRAEGSRITGGGVTTFNGDKAYFTLWEWEGKTYTLYQFMPSTFHLRENFAEHETTASAPASAAPAATRPGDCRVWYWSEPEHHCGWAVVSAADVKNQPFQWNW